MTRGARYERAAMVIDGLAVYGVLWWYAGLAVALSLFAVGFMLGFVAHWLDSR